MKKPHMQSDSASIWADPLLRPYLGEISRRHGVVDTLALPNLRDLPPLRIEKLFVQPELSEIWVSPLSEPTGWPEGKTLLNTLSESSVLVLLGDPGSGKTTLMNWLAWRLSTGLTKALPEGLSDLLPIPCVLREMKPELFGDQITISDLAVAVARKLLGNKLAEKIEGALQLCIASGKYILLLDGVDEISPAYRRAVARWMGQVALAGAYAVATSRIIGYDDYPIHNGIQDKRSSLIEEREVIINDPLVVLDEAHATYSDKKDGGHLLKTFEKSQEASVYIKYLMPFDKKRINLFVSNWYLQRCGSEQEAKQKAIDLMEALQQSSATLELARIPNLLSLIAIVYRERAHLPDGKALLYREIVNAYINTIDQNKKITSDDALSPYEREAREGWLAYVGFKMQIAREQSEYMEDHGVLMEEEQVLKWLEDAMSRSGVKDCESNAKVFLDWVARRSGLLIPRGEGVYAFIHLSFQEYFCARFIARCVVNPKFVMGVVEPNAHVTKESLLAWCSNPLWHETLIYLLELISAEEDIDWLDNLLEVLFLKIPNEELRYWVLHHFVARIMLDKHISSPKKWMDNFAANCALIDDEFVMSALIKKEYMYLHAPKDYELDYFYRTQEVSKVAEIANLNAKLDIYRVAIFGEKTLNFIEINECINILKLTIENCNVYKSESSSLNSLKSLSIIQSYFESFNFIKDLTSIEHLNIHRSNFCDLSVLVGLKKLRDLYLHDANVKDISALSALEKIVKLSLNDTNVNDISSLSGLKNLVYFSLSNTGVIDISSVSNFKKLKSLNLDGTKISDISAISSLKKLEQVDVSNTLVFDITCLSGLKDLVHLNLNGLKINDPSPLRKLKKLNFLLLANTQIKDISCIADLKNVSILILKGSSVEDLSPLVKMKKLTHLVLGDMKIKDYSFLKEIASLEVLFIEDSMFDAPVIKQLKNVNVRSASHLRY